MNIDLTPLGKAAEPLWILFKSLFAEHHFLTILCGFFAVSLILRCYAFLRSISPALVGLMLLLVVSVLFLHWTQTRTEPAFLKPVVDYVVPFFPSSLPQRAMPVG